MQSNNKETMEALIRMNETARLHAESSREIGEKENERGSGYHTYHERSEEFHTYCAKCVKKLAGSKSGVVSSNYRNLSNFKDVKIGDPVCLITYDYTKVLLNEENSDDINTVLEAEEMERKIRELNKHDPLNVVEENRKKLEQYKIKNKI